MLGLVIIIYNIICQSAYAANEKKQKRKKFGIWRRQ